VTDPAAALRAIGWPADRPAGWEAMLAAHPGARPARVVEQHRSGYVVAEGPGDGLPAESLPDWQRPPAYRKGEAAAEDRAAVGDWVLVEGTGGALKIVALLPRFSAIKRGAAGEHYRQQVIAANVDTALVVSGLDADFNPRRIERYLLLVAGTGVTPVVVLTKADKALAGDSHSIESALRALADIVAQGTDVIAVNAKAPEAAQALAPRLPAGTTAVLVGSSGAGKSTLTNTLLGIERMRTAEVRATDDRGRHTTTHRALIPLPSGACLIDTPGMRELKPTGEEDVAESFADIQALADDCRFRDCAHAREPGCAVRAAMEAGTVAPARVANYLKLQAEVAAASTKLADRRTAQKKSKS